MKPGDDGSGLSFANDIISLSTTQVDPAPCSRRVESLTLVYNHTGRERSLTGAIHVDRKSYITIMEVSLLSARKRILANTGS
jgi:hypothetical protein